MRRFRRSSDHKPPARRSSSEISVKKQKFPLSPSRRRVHLSPPPSHLSSSALVSPMPPNLRPSPPSSNSTAGTVSSPSTKTLIPAPASSLPSSTPFSTPTSPSPTALFSPRIQMMTIFHQSFTCLKPCKQEFSLCTCLRPSPPGFSKKPRRPA